MDISNKGIIKLAYPIIIVSAIQNTISITDTAFMGRVGEVEQAAIGLISIYYLILFMIGFSYTKGTQILIARRQGEGRERSVGRIFDQSALILLTFAGLILLALQFFGDASVSLVVSDPDVAREAADYLRVRSFGLIFGFLGVVFLAFYMGIGRTLIIFYSIVVLTLINIFLNYVLIFGKWGFPEMGIEGAALASNISEVVSVAVFIIFAISLKHHRRYRLFRQLKFNRKLAARISSIGFPIVLQTFLGLVTWMLFFIYVEKMGTRPLAISNVVKQIYMFFGIPAWGFATVTNTIISYMMGQERQNEVGGVIKKIVLLSFLFIFAISLVMGLFPRYLMRIFTDNPDLIEQGVPVMYVCIVALWACSIATILFHGIVSTGSTWFSLLVEVITIALYVLFIQIIFRLPGLTLPVAWTSEVFYWMVIAICSLVYLRTGHWKKVKI